MRHRLFLSAVLVTIVCVVCLAATGKPVVLSSVTIRAYNNFGISTPTLDRAERISAAILGDAGVQAVWRNCRMAGGPGASSRDACSDSLEDDEVIVRIVRAPDAIGGPNAPFGYSLVSTDARRGSLATVFGDHISRAADRVRLDQSVLLGRAIAHELGHLLLGTTSHSSEGLMRAIWPDSALLSRAAADWTFSTIDLARLRLALSFSSSSPLPSLR